MRERPRSCGSAEGVGFEPTVPEGTTVFETVRFGRSRIPPGGSLSAPLVGEEAVEQGGAPIGQDAGGDRQLVVQAGVDTQVVERAAGPGLRVGGPEDQP